MLFIYTSFIVNNSLRSSRLEVVDERENKRAREGDTREVFLVPTTSTGLPRSLHKQFQ